MSYVMNKVRAFPNMNEIFERRKTNRAVQNQYKLNLEIPIINQATFGAKRIRYLGPKIRNSLPFHQSSNESLTTFKRIKIQGTGIKKTGTRSHSNVLFISARVLLLK